MTSIHTAFVATKQYFLDLGLVLGVSFLTNFWHALSDEFNILMVAHAIVLLIVAIFVKVVGRWIGEQIDDLSDIEFMHRFPCDRSKFDLLKNIHTHGLLYTPNIAYIPYDGNKIKISSKVLWIKTIETFELQDKGDTVVLKNISGKYESSVTYEWYGDGIAAHWIAKPKGLRRAFSLLFAKKAERDIIKDFQSFVDKK